jgi:2-dehydro-3-deoxyphosphogluconate aldolase/(4S)-4-hydroxy-2-oxoglutarate aldolase
MITIEVICPQTGNTKSMNSQFNIDTLQRIERCGVVAVLVIDHLRDATSVARALLAGGIGAMELTLRTPVALDALRAIRDEFPDMLAGVGTILTTEQVDQVAAAGAAFGVAPGTNPSVIRAAQNAGLPFAPGIVTPSDVEIALELGCRELKFFPSEPSGGVPYLKSLAAPYLHLGVRFVPLGGVNAENAGTYLAEPSILAVGGSWLAPRQLIQQQDWSSITANAQQATQIVQQAGRRDSV